MGDNRASRIRPAEGAGRGASARRSAGRTGRGYSGVSKVRPRADSAGPSFGGLSSWGYGRGATISRDQEQRLRGATAPAGWPKRAQAATTSGNQQGR